MDYKECFSIFNSSYTDKEIPKDVLLNNIDNNEDKEIIERFVNNIFLKYCIKAENINKKSEKNFSEIEIIEININNYRTIYDIYGILLSIIPYPLLAIFRYNDRISFAVSNRIPAEDKNNKGKIYTSYLIKQEDIYSYLKIDIDSCQTMIEIYNKWISNIENVVAYYERLDRVMEIIEIGFHIKSNEVLEKLESYIIRDCGTYNMKPKDGWKSKLEKYEDSSSFIKKVEIHMLWEYLLENTFFKNKLDYFINWNDFKEACAYSNNMNDIYYSQYNSRISNNYEIDDIYENRRNNNRYKNHSKNMKVETIKSESERIRKIKNIDNTIQEIVEEVKEKGDISYRDLAEIMSEKLVKFDTETINKIFEAIKKYGIKIIKDDEDIKDKDEYRDEEYDSVEYEMAREEVEKDFMLYAIKIDCDVLSYASNKLLNDKEFMLQAIEENIGCTKYASDELRNDKEFMLQAIEKKIFTIWWVSNELLNNREFMIEAIQKNYFALGYASDELKNDKEFMQDVIKQDELYIGYLGKKLKNDKEFMLQAIRQNSWNVTFIGEKLRNDKEFMLKAIEQDSWSILCTSNELSDDENYKLQAIKLDSWCINFINPRMKNNKEFMLQAIKINSLCIEYVDDDLLKDRDFFKKVNDIVNFSKYESQQMITNKEIISQAIENKDIWCFAYVDPELRNNKEFMLHAIERDSSCIGYSSNELLNDSEFMIEVIKKNPRCINFANKRLKSDKEFMLQAIEKDIFCMAYARDELKNDKEFMLQAVKKDIRSISYASDELRNDKEFMLQAMKEDIRCYAYASDELRNDLDLMIEIMM